MRILTLPEYQKLASDSKFRVKSILRLAAQKPLGDSKGQRNYYLTMLKEALTTPFKGTESGRAEYGCSPDAAKANEDEVADALKREALWAGAYSDVDEQSVATAKHLEPRRGQGGKIFWVDRSDPKDIRVKFKVRLIGAPAEVSKIKQLEDAIERAISIDTKGYHLDLVFVDKPAFDVFEFSVQFCQWANSGNWAAGPETLSHELHHALGLDDRYDYIEAHAKNPQMNVSMRLVWFLEQMKKNTSARDPFSKMNENANPLLAEDVCSVAFPDGPQRQKCIEARRDLDPPGLPKQ
ncbi:MAG: hypothetical protein QM784_37145 [Polyangiaceae bacterium]